VNGRGVEYLEKAGIEVERGCLEEEGAYLNRRFFHYVNYKRPYVILKWAQTADGFIDVKRERGDREGPRWISDPLSRTLVHKWRSEESAIMVGTNTVIADNPELTVRRWTGENPVRITFDRKGRLPAGVRILDGKNETIVFTGVQRNYAGKTQRVHTDPSYRMVDAMEELFDRQVVSLLVEGGASLHNSFLESGLWDEARVFTGKMLFSRGIKAPEIDEIPCEIQRFGETKLEIFRNSLNELRES
jgi:diaminohydroxyphosphoribosylaminopyrimidine deaminase/5-amino-6-(5-phosphoribosylamino)uracil reductase